MKRAFSAAILAVMFIANNEIFSLAVMAAALTATLCALLKACIEKGERK